MTTRELVLAALLGAATLALAWILIAGQEYEPNSTNTTVAKEAPQTRSAARVVVPVRNRVMAYPNRVKERLPLPQDIRDDPGQHVVTASRVEPDIHPHTITTVLDTETGRFETYDTKEPLPWIARTSNGEAGVSYGMRNGQAHGRVFVRVGLLDIKALRLSGEAILDQDGDWYTGLTLAYRW